MSILDYVPAGYTLRSVQRDVLLDVERQWNDHNVFVLQVPVAGGKSLIAMIIAAWQKGAAILTPQVILQEQYHKDFSHIPLLKGKARYTCDECLEWRERFPDYDEVDCSNCAYRYRKAVIEAQGAPTSILNFHSYLYNQIYKKTLIVDEAHNLTSMLSELYALKIWQHKENYPDSLDTKDDLIPWLQDECKKLHRTIGKHKGLATPAIAKSRGRLRKYQLVIEGLQECREQFFISKSMKPYRGKNYEVLEARPITLRKVPHNMWPMDKVEKIVLLSATINNIDIERLGLDRRHVCYITCESPIPTGSRPIYINPVADMGFSKTADSIEPMTARINELVDQYSGKGIVHVTYGLIPQFKKYLKGSRFIWHDKDNKMAQYDKFRASKDKVLIAAGMSEGIDLNGLEFEWQAIAKVIFPSLAEPINKYYLTNERELYAYETVRTLIQQYGRICRGPEDVGHTYILDKLFKMVYIRNSAMFPKYFKDALHWR